MNYFACLKIKRVVVYFKHFLKKKTLLCSDVIKDR